MPAKTEKTNQFNVMHKDMSKEGLQRSFKSHRLYTLSKDEYTATAKDNYHALAQTIRERLVERWIQTHQTYHKKNVKRVYYLSMEFLIGRLLENYIYNLGIETEVKEAMKELGLDLEQLREQEEDAGLGNGGLGRLAACFLDSMATLAIPAYGYGIRYDYGIFRQKIRDGHQVEMPDEWLRLGSPWEIPRPEYTVKVKFYGHVNMIKERNGRIRAQWDDTQDVLAVPYDIPIPGFQNDIVNTLRLWSARATEDFDFDYFKNGDYEQAVYKKIFSENISKVLYPADNVSQGKELRLKQEYFFTAAAISDIIRRYKINNSSFDQLPEKVTIQLNDTHPALGVVELMRVLLDDYDFEWDEAWKITTKVFAYTNHTLLPEALEKWSVALFERLLPRHLQLIYEINARFLRQVSNWKPGDKDMMEKLSLIEEGSQQKVRMAHLAVVGSHSVNGVSALHSDLLQKYMFKDFHEFYPGKFNNKTNGITQRAWLLKSNPLLSGLINQTIGDDWTTDLYHLEKLLPYTKDKTFCETWSDIKLQNKNYLAEYIYKQMKISVDPTTMFDVQVKRIHEYKRQLLFAFYIISEYLKLKNDPKSFIQPRTFMVGGKAAPGYYMAKLIIKFINSIGDIVNNDPTTKNKIKVIFLENYRVSLAEKIFPASDLSEQISTAGMEASGTGNMKFMLNGALTIGTLDGANVEMAEEAGEENLFIFGLKTPEVADLKQNGYSPQQFIQASPVLAEILRLIKGNFFESNEPGLFDPIYHALTGGDQYLVCADFESYCEAQNKVNQVYQNQDDWTTKSIVNVAKTGKFSSDRTIRDYAKDIWGVL